MADEPNVGDSPQTSEDPQIEPLTDTSADPYEKKTEEELKAILREKESFIGKQTTEIGDLRTKMNEIENQIAFNKQFGGQQIQSEPNPLDTQYGNFGENQPSMPTAEEVPFDFMDNPRKYYRKWREEERRKEQEDYQKKDMEIRSHIFRAKPFLEQAKKETPHLFKDISPQELETALYNGLANNLVSPYALGDTKTYKQAAMWIVGEKTDYGFNFAGTSPNPVQPTQTESYAANRPSTETPEPVNLGLDTKVMIQGMGKEMQKLGMEAATEEEVAEMVRKEKAERKRRES